ncbi:DNA topoisomerase IB [Loktanella agnita]|uniref:DNA topoisomerase IB n=1 Tax=Loktanella agnita TaxID=287097 RepID=UPI003989249A
MAPLVYYPDDQPGIRRQKRGRGFSYLAPDGTTIDDKAERTRLAAMAVPPAYVDVWMCPLAHGHLQATGRDDRQRKQYRYHPDWTAAQAQVKFEKLIDFGHALPRIRRTVRRHLSEDAGEKTFALASAVAMIDRLSLRVGHDSYTRENGSYGALTLRRRHVKLAEGKIALNYVAKGGKRVRRQLADRTLSRILNKIGDLPGATLLSWLDDQGAPQTLSSEALNSYIADSAGGAFTAKTFRTWAGTLAAFEVAAEGPVTIKAMSDAAAARLHNTPTIARNSYIHPDVIALSEGDVTLAEGPKTADLRQAERRLLAYLER